MQIDLPFFPSWASRQGSSARRRSCRAVLTGGRSGTPEFAPPAVRPDGRSLERRRVADAVRPFPWPTVPADSRSCPRATCAAPGKQESWVDSPKHSGTIPVTRQHRPAHMPPMACGATITRFPYLRSPPPACHTPWRSPQKNALVEDVTGSSLALHPSIACSSPSCYHPHRPP